MIRLPDVPGLQGTAVNMPKMDVGAAAAPGVALGRVGSAIASIGDEFADVAHKIQKQVDSGTILSKRRQLNEDFANHQLELEKDQDPASRIQKTKDFFTNYKGKLLSDDMSPIVRGEVENYYEDFASQASIRQGVDSANLAVKRNTQAFENEMGDAVKAGDRNRLDQAIRLWEAAGTTTPEEVAKTRSKGYLQIDHNNNLAAISDDPETWLKSNPKDKIPDGYDAQSWNQLQEFSKGKVREHTNEVTDAAQDTIIADRLTADQVQEKFKGLRPELLYRLQTFAGNYGSEEAKIERAKPEFQARVIGEASRLLHDYQPKFGEEIDQDAVNIRQTIDQLPPGNAMRDALLEQLKARRDGAELEVKTRLDQAYKTIDEISKTGGYGKLAGSGLAEETTARVLESEFLNDGAKLKQLGLTDAQIKSVNGMEPDSKSPTGWKGKDKPTDAVALKKMRDQQLSAFRALAPNWNQRGPVTAPQFVQDAAETILNNRGDVKSPDPIAQQQAADAQAKIDQRVGTVKTEMRAWSKLNPNAGEKEYSDKLNEISGRVVRQNLQESKFGEKPRPSSDTSTSQAMPPGQNLMDTIKNWEAGGPIKDPKVNAYWDNKQWSIGYGTHSKEGETITAGEAEKRLTLEIQETRSQVETEAKRVGLVLKPNELDALTSFSHNLGTGIGGLRTLLADGKRSKAEIADAMLLYRNADGKPSNGLERRRKSERALFLNGYPS